MSARHLALASLVAIVALAIVLGRTRSFEFVRLPTPTGSAAIGTALVSIGLGDGRTTMLQVWYPASRAIGERAPYAMGLALPLRSRAIAAMVRTDAYVDAPLGVRRLPVVLYVPGLGGNRATNTTLAQDLASHGYAVFAMNDTRPQSSGFDFSTPLAVRRSIAAGERKLMLESRDVSAVISALGALDRERGGRFAGRLDLARLGFFGFSFGGAIGAETAARDRRIVATINLDGWNLGRSLREGVDRPQLVMLSTPLVRPDDRARTNVPVDRASFDRKIGSSIAFGLRRFGGYVVEVDGFGHNDFTDAFLLPSFRHRGGGTIDSVRGYHIVEWYVRAFFDRYLKGEPSTLLRADRAIEKAVRFHRFERSPVRSIERRVPH